MTGFKITDGKGFRITFENGHTISVQFGSFNYCSNKHPLRIEDRNAGEKGSADAEVIVILSTGELMQLEDDTVAGWQSPSQVLELMNKVAKL